MTWKVASLYVATVIGAGFATGQEIIQFFARFGFTGIFGLVITTTFLSLFGGLILEKCFKVKSRSYFDLLNQPPRLFPSVIDLSYTFFILMGLSIMLAGAETVLDQFLIQGTGRYLTAILVLIPLLLGLEQILNITAYLVPVMILLILAVSLKTIQIGDLSIPSQFMPGALPYSLLYSGYNLGYALAVFAGISRLIKDDKTARRGGILGGLLLGLLIAIMILAFFSTPPALLNDAIPMLNLAKRIGAACGIIYSIVIWFAMYTTALANATAVTQRISGMFPTLKHLASICVVALALLMAGWGFVPLIKVTYPLFGVVGLFLVFKLLYF